MDLSQTFENDNSLTDAATAAGAEAVRAQYGQPPFDELDELV